MSDYVVSFNEKEIKYLAGCGMSENYKRNTLTQALMFMLKGKYGKENVNQFYGSSNDKKEYNFSFKKYEDALEFYVEYINKEAMGYLIVELTEQNASYYMEYAVKNCKPEEYQIGTFFGSYNTFLIILDRDKALQCKLKYEGKNK